MERYQTPTSLEIANLQNFLSRTRSPGETFEQFESELGYTCVE
jgi:hypothetical protein